jgi:hypothetical protein
METESESRAPGARRKVVRLLGDGPEISLNSVSGSLQIFGAQGQTPPPEDAAPQEDRMNLLDKIASGELSVDDVVTAFQE